MDDKDDKPDSPWAKAEAARQRVQKLARLVAADAPARQGQHVFRAGIQWTLIHDLRAAIAELDEITDNGRRP